MLPRLEQIGIHAGLHLVLRSRDTDFDDVAAVRGLAERGLTCTALSQYFIDSQSASARGLVLGYSRLPETQAAAAVRTMRAFLHQ